MPLVDGPCFDSLYAGRDEISLEEIPKIGVEGYIKAREERDEQRRERAGTKGEVAGRLQRGT